MGQRYPVVIGLCDSQGSWLRHVVSGNYHISYLNRRIFRKFTTHVIGEVNIPSLFHEYII